MWRHPTALRWIALNAVATWSSARECSRAPSRHDRADGVQITLQAGHSARWLAYVSDESGRREVYVRPFPSGAGRWQISSEGGIEPRWARRGHEIIHRGRGWFLAVPLTLGAGFSIGRVDSLFQGSYLLSVSRAEYDVSADGSEFLVVGTPANPRALSVTLNRLVRLTDPSRAGNPR